MCNTDMIYTMWHIVSLYCKNVPHLLMKCCSRNQKTAAYCFHGDTSAKVIRVASVLTGLQQYVCGCDTQWAMCVSQQDCSGFQNCEQYNANKLKWSIWNDLLMQFLYITSNMVLLTM